MKKLFLLGVLLLPIVAGASTIACSTVESYAQWSAPGFSCEADDLVFSSFSASSGDLSNMSLNFLTGSFTDPGSQWIALNLVNGTFTQDFVLSYTVTLDDTAFPADNNPGWFISAASAEVQAQTGAYGSLEKQIYQSDGGTLLGTDTYTQSGTSGGDIGPVLLNQTSIYVVDKFDYTSGTFYNASNTFSEDPVPEPSTMLLMGATLVGLGMIGRKRRKSS